MLTLRGLDARYGAAHVLFGVDLELEDGSLTALLGRNGAGKTTTAMAIAGIGPRCTGELRYQGRDVGRWPAFRRARAGIQLVPDNRRVYPMLSVRENLELGLSACGGRRGMRVAELADLFPTLSRLLDRMGDQLSGGEQQLVAIARALVSRPHLLIMDEPSQGLAPVILEQVGEAVRTLRASLGTTVLLTEQNVEFAGRLADRVVVIDGGRVVYTGSRDEFRDRRDVRGRYLSVDA
jgi:branched-chain amino acid transport system ATP-binding protein